MTKTIHIEVIVPASPEYYGDVTDKQAELIAEVNAQKITKMLELDYPDAEHNITIQANPSRQMVWAQVKCSVWDAGLDGQALAEERDIEQDITYYIESKWADWIPDAVYEMDNQANSEEEAS